MLGGSLAAQQDTLPLDSVSSRSTILSACMGYQARVGLHCCLLGWVCVSGFWQAGVCAVGLRELLGDDVRVLDVVRALNEAAHTLTPTSLQLGGFGHGRPCPLPGVVCVWR